MADGISVHIDGGEFGGLANRLQALLGDMTEPMDWIGKELETRVLRCFDTERSPSGRPWEPLSPVTIAQRERLGKWPGKILDRDAAGNGGLIGSITHEAGPDFVELGSNSKYASTHQLGAKQGAFGTTKRGGPIPWGDIPARPFLFEGTLDDPTLPDEWAEAVIDILADSIAEAEEGR